jgi:hypothetical protein
MVQGDKRIGWPTLAALWLVVVAFMGLSLVVTANGTARFATAMGYDANVGYAVGAIFDIAKCLLPVALAALVARRALGIAVVLGAAWLCLLTFSWLATHATVSTAISTIERSGTWTMEVRGNTKAELISVEQQLASLSRTATPRPTKTVREALAAERVPSVWQDSRECRSIQDSAYFMKACAQIVQLRRELAASEDYERLSARATELRKGLAEAPIVATSDPLPAAFSATLGRVLPMSGAEGIALLLTVVVELISCFGLAGLTVLNKDSQDQQRAPPGNSSPLAPSAKAKTTDAPATLPKGRVQRLPRLSIFPRLVRVRGPARPPPQMPYPSPPGCPKGRLLGKLGPPACLPDGLKQSLSHSLPVALPKAVRLPLPPQRPWQIS